MADEGSYGFDAGDEITTTEAETVEINVSETEEVEIGKTNDNNENEVEIGKTDVEESNEVKIGKTDVEKTSHEKSATVNIDESNSSKAIEVNVNQNEELRAYLEKESTYSMEVNKYISSPEELQVYKDAGLVEKNIDGRICLIREDLDLDYVDKQSGLTNAELIAKGRSPYDAKTGERIELHHIGQDFNAPFAELKSVSEHDIYSKTLHKSETDSWRRDPEKVSQYTAQRKAHWKNRA